MTVAPRYPHLAFVLTLCVVVALVWAWQPNPLVVVALCLLPIATLYVLNQTFWLVLLFVVFSFFVSMKPFHSSIL